MSTPAWVFPEMRLRVGGLDPPIVFEVAPPLIVTPFRFPRAELPELSMPTKLPSTTFAEVPSPVMLMPLPGVSRDDVACQTVDPQIESELVLAANVVGTRSRID